MIGIKYFALDENEEVPYEFVVTRNVNGKPEFCASFVNTNTLAYGNGVLLKLHQRNDELRAENAKLRELLADTLIDPRDYCAKYGIDYDGWDSANEDIDRRLRELGIKVGE